MEEKERYEIHIYDDICVDLYDNGVLYKSINDTYKLEELLNQQDKRLKEFEQENQQLKQQLHDLPKKIVEEIKDKIPEIGGMKCEIIIDDFLTLNTLLDTILKKYSANKNN